MIMTTMRAMGVSVCLFGIAACASEAPPDEHGSTESAQTSGNTRAPAGKGSAARNADEPATRAPAEPTPEYTEEALSDDADDDGKGKGGESKQIGIILRVLRWFLVADTVIESGCTAFDAYCRGMAPGICSVGNRPVIRSEAICSEARCNVECGAPRR